MINLNTLYLLFIFTGLTIILTLLYLRYITRKTFRMVIECIDLNEKCAYDLNSFLPAAIPILKKAGIEDLYYTIQFLDGSLDRARIGRRKGMEKRVQRDDYSLRLGMVPGTGRGERGFIYQIALEILFLVVEMDILIRINAVNDAFYNFSKLQTFMLHDMKNLTQFIKALSYNVEHLRSGEREERFLQFLKQSVPGLLVRVNRIQGVLEMGHETTPAEEEGVKEFRLGDLLRSILTSYSVRCDIVGDAVLSGQESKVASIFDNLLKNVYEKSLEQSGVECTVRIEEQPDHVAVSVIDTGRPLEEPGRVFEPFYSRKKGGLGVGLFQVKNLVASLGGTVEAQNGRKGVEFSVKLPKAASLKEVSM